MKNEFNGKSTGLSAFVEKKNALRQEFNEILGFDLSAIRNVRLKPAFLDFGLGVTCEYFEPDYLDVTQKTPIFFGLTMKTTGIRSWFDSMTNATVIAFKKDDKWCLSAGRFDQVIDEDIRTVFHDRLRFCGVKIEDLQPMATSSTSSPNLKP